MVKSWRFSNSNKTFFFEPRFILSLDQDKIVRKDGLYEHDEIFGVKGCGFLPCNLKDYRNYCREQYAKYKEEEVMPYVLPKTNLKEFENYINEESELYPLLEEGIIEFNIIEEIIEELKILAKTVNKPISVIEECVDEIDIDYSSGELPIYVGNAKPNGDVIFKNVCFIFPDEEL